MERRIKILQHRIEYWYKPDREMPEHEQEHIKQAIGEGFSSGQLTDEKYIGWWKIM